MRQASPLVHVPDSSSLVTKDSGLPSSAVIRLESQLAEGFVVPDYEELSSADEADRGLLSTPVQADCDAIVDDESSEL